MKLSACIEWLFADETDDIVARIRLAAESGLHGVEFHQWENKPIDAIVSALEETGLSLTSHIVEPRRSLVEPSEHGAFLDAVKTSLAAARRLGAPALVVASGFEIEGRSREAQRDAAIAVLKQAARMADDAGKTLLLEPLNTKVDHPGMFLRSAKDGLDIVERVGSPALRLLYDAYHSIVMGEEPAAALAGRMDLVGHVQVADAPGRGAPGTGGIDWTSVKDALSAGGYDGFWGLEFKLNGLSTRESLAIARKALGG